MSVPSLESDRLRLWLPGYHTPGLNVTTGRHWGIYYKHKKAAAAALLEALPCGRGTRAHLVLDAIAKGGCAGSQSAAIKSAAAAESERLRSRMDVRQRSRSHLLYVRVTCQPLDTENFVGSTKALTDCLRAAFPAMLPEDAPEWVSIEHRQERCGCRDEEGTWVMLAAGGQNEVDATPPQA